MTSDLNFEIKSELVNSNNVKDLYLQLFNIQNFPKYIILNNIENVSVQIMFNYI